MMTKIKASGKRCLAISWTIWVKLRRAAAEHKLWIAICSALLKLCSVLQTVNSNLLKLCSLLQVLLCKLWRKPIQNLFNCALWFCKSLFSLTESLCFKCWQPRTHNSHQGIASSPDLHSTTAAGSSLKTFIIYPPGRDKIHICILSRPDGLMIQVFM